MDKDYKYQHKSLYDNIRALITLSLIRRIEKAFVMGNRGRREINMPELVYLKSRFLGQNLFKEVVVVTPSFSF